MKTKHLSLLVIPSLLLSSCTFLFGVKSLAKDINVYDIDKLDTSNNLSSGFQNTIKARFVSGQDYIPYLTLSQYASLYEKHFASDVESKVSKSAFGSTWTISRADGTYFACGIDYFSGEIILAGSIEAAFSDDDDPRDLEALHYGLKTETKGLYLSDTTYATFKFSGYKFTHFNADNDHYYPLGLLDIAFHDSSGLYFTYNYSHILSTRDVDNYSVTEYIDNGNTYTFDSQMKASKVDEVIPTYLRDYNSNLFIFLMDHFYGLKNQKGIKSMANYYAEKGFYSNLFSSDNGTRTMAFSDALSCLDDNHTILYGVNDTWGDPNYQPVRRYGDGCHSRSRLRSELKGYRDDAGITADRDIVYSADGKTALFSFDSFAFGSSSQVFNEDKSIKENAKNYDTFFLFLDVFSRIKQHGSVENIIFDVSLNGGGTVGVMMKLLGLLSKDNSSYLAFYDDTTTQLAIYNSQVDINNDEKYDTDDCFGDDYNFYILTSDYSFSCGNAFPCIAQVKNYAKIIGQKSGGGECAVSVHFLPNSEYVYHSSNLHLGYYDEQMNEFKGFENGATPDIELPINANFYSIETLNTAITNAQ